MRANATCHFIAASGKTPFDPPALKKSSFASAHNIAATESTGKTTILDRFSKWGAMGVFAAESGHNLSLPKYAN